MSQNLASWSSTAGAFPLDPKQSLGDENAAEWDAPERFPSAVGAPRLTS